MAHPPRYGPRPTSTSSTSSTRARSSLVVGAGARGAPVAAADAGLPVAADPAGGNRGERAAARRVEDMAIERAEEVRPGVDPELVDAVVVARGRHVLGERGLVVDRDL